MKTVLKIGFLFSVFLMFMSCDLKIKSQNFEVEAILQDEVGNSVSRSISYNPERNNESSRLVEFSATEMGKLSSQKLHFNIREGLPDLNTQYTLTSIIQDKNYTISGGGLLSDLFSDVNYGNDWVRNKMGRTSSLRLHYHTLSDSLVEKQNQVDTNTSMPVVNWLYRINKNDSFISDTLKEGQILNTNMLDSLIFNQLKSRVLEINNSDALENLPAFTTIRFPEEDPNKYGIVFNSACRTNK